MTVTTPETDGQGSAPPVDATEHSFRDGFVDGIVQAGMNAALEVASTSAQVTVECVSLVGRVTLEVAGSALDGF